MMMLVTSKIVRYNELTKKEDPVVLPELSGLAYFYAYLYTGTKIPLGGIFNKGTLEGLVFTREATDYPLYYEVEYQYPQNTYEWWRVWLTPANRELWQALGETLGGDACEELVLRELFMEDLQDFFGVGEAKIGEL